jgi:hypothetical protein
MTKENEDETPELEAPPLYTVSPQDLLAVSRTLTKLDELEKDTFVEIPHRLLLRSFDDWMPIGYAVYEEGWFFEAITSDEREQKGKL